MDILRGSEYAQAKQQMPQYETLISNKRMPTYSISRRSIFSKQSSGLLFFALLALLMNTILAAPIEEEPAICPEGQIWNPTISGCIR
jgi:hypothetical protein